MSSDAAKIRAVFDCMMFVQGAARREGVAGAWLVLVEVNAIGLYVFQRNLGRGSQRTGASPRAGQRFPALTDQIVHRFLGALDGYCSLFSEVPPVFRFDRDPKDEPYINLAITARASYLVSWDKDILDLANTSASDGERLRSHAPKLQIVEPRAFLAEVRKRLHATGYTKLFGKPGSRQCRDLLQSTRLLEQMTSARNHVQRFHAIHSPQSLAVPLEDHGIIRADDCERRCVHALQRVDGKIEPATARHHCLDEMRKFCSRN